MVRFVAAVLAAGVLAGCGDKPQPTPPTEFKNKKDDHDHDHERDGVMFEDAGPYHAGLTAHLSKDGNEIDVLFETVGKKPKPVPLPLTKLTGRATREGDKTEHVLEFEPADAKERPDDPGGKCSRFSAKAGWMKPEDKLTVTLVVPIEGTDRKVVWVDFNPKKYSHTETLALSQAAWPGSYACEGTRGPTSPRWGEVAAQRRVRGSHAQSHPGARPAPRPLMDIPHLHDWPTTAAEAVELQAALAARIDVSTPLGAFDLVAGCDAAYHLTDPVVYAAVVVVRAADGAVVETATATREANFPYIPGLLSFRELPAILDAFARLRSAPDAVMIDAQGVAHPRRFGSACHLGLWLGRPTVGCAKSWLVGEYEEPGAATGDAAPLLVAGEPVGAVVRSAGGAKPVFVSPGHLADVAGATRLVRATLSGYRQPTPTRAAHLAANALRASAGG